MNRRALATRVTLMAVGALLVCASPLPALAQSCALCYTQAASAGTRMIEALRSGILILIVPPTLMSVAMIFIMRRSQNRCRDSAGNAESDATWHGPGLSRAATIQWHPLGVVTDHTAKEAAGDSEKTS